MGSYAHFAPFLKVIILLVSKILRKNGVKGALDKYNIYLFVSCSKENFITNQYQKFQPILPMRFHFIQSFAINIIPRVPHRPLYCVFFEVDFKKSKLL